MEKYLLAAHFPQAIIHWVEKMHEYLNVFVVSSGGMIGAR